MLYVYSVLKDDVGRCNPFLYTLWVYTCTIVRIDVAGICNSCSETMWVPVIRAQRRRVYSSSPACKDKYGNDTTNGLVAYNGIH